MKTLKYIGITLLLLTLTIACKNKSESKHTHDSKSSKKVLFVVTSHNKLGNTNKKTGYWLSEISHPWKEITQIGYEIDFVSPKGGVVPIDPGSVDEKDSLNIAFLEDEIYQQKIKNTLKPSQINPNDYIAIYFAGGHGVMWDFPNNKNLADITTKIYENGGAVSATCHGAAGLVNVKLSNGEYLIANKKISGFTNEEESEINLTNIVPFSLEDALTKNGAKFQKLGLWQEQVSVDERVITGQNPQSAKAVGLKITEFLKNK